MSRTVVITELKLQPPLMFSIKANLLYRPAFSSTWTTFASNVTINTDGSISGSPLPSFSISENTRYYLRADNENCETFYQEEIFYPCSTSCPIGYTLAPDSSYCYKINEVAPTPPSGSPDTLVAKNGVSYGTCGSYIYNSGYNVNGTGTSTQISLSNAFWKNGGTCADNNTSDGVMNRAAVWASSTTDNQDIGFTVCVNIMTTKTYYIGVGCDNYASIKIDGVTIVMQDETALNAQYSVVGACFKVFHIYPITLTAGVHYMELFGHNVSSQAAVAIEVYDNTSAQIQAATSYSGLNLIFSTKNEVGQFAYLGTNGYSCPSGYSLDACDSPLLCKQIITTNTTC